MKKRHVPVLASVLSMLAACGASSDGADDASGIASLDPVAASTNDDSTAPQTVSSDSEDGPTPEDAEAAMAAWEKCANDLGLGDLFSDGDGGGVQTEVGNDAEVAAEAFVDEEAFERLQEECDPLLADVIGDFELSPEQEAAQRDAELEFARCMRDAGIDFPDPTGGGGGSVIEFGDDVDPDELDAAFDECDEAFDELYADSEADQ